MQVFNETWRWTVTLSLVHEVIPFDTGDTFTGYCIIMRAEERRKECETLRGREKERYSRNN